MEILTISDEDYISLNDVENYLDEACVIDRLENIYFRYKGFADFFSLQPKPIEAEWWLNEELVLYYNLVIKNPHEDKHNALTYWNQGNEELYFDGELLGLNWYYNPVANSFLEKIDNAPIYWNKGKEEVYIDGLIKYSIHAINEIHSRESKGYPFEENYLYIALIEDFLGKQNGIKHTIKKGLFLYSTPPVIRLSIHNSEKELTYAKVSDLDALAEKYGIPKNAPQAPSPNQSLEPNKTKTTGLIKENDLRKILVIKAPSDNNRIYQAMKRCIDDFETEHNYTPTFEELFPILVRTDFSDLDVEFLNGTNGNKKATTARYNRYYLPPTAK